MLADILPSCSIKIGVRNDAEIHEYIRRKIVDYFLLTSILMDMKSLNKKVSD